VIEVFYDYWAIPVFTASFIISCFSIYYCIYFARKLLFVTEQIENSLDILDERYASIDRILKIPLFHDSLEVRQVLKDIEASRNAILEVAAVVGRVEEAIDEES
tara:strand:- start:11188 stop:11499 length:312 start_codon:yes stop_codon:yes gene_type:complete